MYDRGGGGRRVISQFFAATYQFVISSYCIVARRKQSFTSSVHFSVGTRAYFSTHKSHTFAFTPFSRRIERCREREREKGRKRDRSDRLATRIEKSAQKLCVRALNLDTPPQWGFTPWISPRCLRKHVVEIRARVKDRSVPTSSRGCLTTRQREHRTPEDKEMKS